MKKLIRYAAHSVYKFTAANPRVRILVNNLASKTGLDGLLDKIKTRVRANNAIMVMSTASARSGRSNASELTPRAEMLYGQLRKSLGNNKKRAGRF